MSTFEHIFSPIRVGSMELPNRLVMAPMTVDYGNMAKDASGAIVGSAKAMKQINAIKNPM